MKQFRILMASGLFLFLAAPAYLATALGDLVASMPVRSWAKLTGVGNSAAIQSLGYITGYGDSAIWDPIAKQFRFVGSVHPGPGHHVVYDDATNTWSEDPMAPSPADMLSHAGDHNAINVSGRKTYFRTGQGGGSSLTAPGRKIVIYDLPSKTWTTTPANMILNYAQDDVGIAYFPELGGVIVVEPNDNSDRAGLFKWDGSAWSRVGAFNTYGPMGYHNQAEYNPVYHCMVFGGGVSTGNSPLFRLDQDGTVASLGNAPFNLSTNSSSHLTLDPVTGLYIVIFSNSTMYTLHPMTGVWTLINGVTPPVLPGDSVCTPVSTYGAVMCYKEVQSTGIADIWVYKHSAATSAATSADTDFNNRCNAPGVTKCVPFDNTTTDIVPYNQPGGNLNPAGDGVYRGVLDTTVKSSGLGSLRFDLPRTVSIANISGSWAPTASNGLGRSFGQNSVFYVQYRMRLSSGMLTNAWDSSWKQSIFHRNNLTCASLELTTNNRSLTNVPMIYTDCGSRAMFDSINGGTDYRLQQTAPLTGNCLYSNSNFKNPAATCQLYEANKWLTFYYKITIGTWGTNSSHIEAWIARDGGAYVKFVDQPNFRLDFDSTTSDAYNNITLTPYMTALSVPGAIDASMWFDELIVSTQPIAAPGGTTSSDTTSPAPPGNLTAN